jgi:hypothetical protein
VSLVFLSGLRERKTGKSIYSMTDISAYQQADFVSLAYFAYVRAAAGEPVQASGILFRSMN